LSIADEGSMPRDFRSGSFGEFTNLVNEMLAAYFGTTDFTDSPDFADSEEN
jgi:hypothetical protein